VRLELVGELSPIITSYYRKLSGGVDEITCAYKSSILSELDGAAESGAEASEAALQEAYLRKLQSLETVEKINGLTMSGPHKDDLALKISGYEMRSVGSQGQCRSAAVAMRFAAVDVASRYVCKPILLLDDIFAELDTNRRDAVASLIRDKGCQVIIATPQVEDLPFTADAVIRL
jgi:DNA replication and repair protein RecF